MNKKIISGLVVLVGLLLCTFFLFKNMQLEINLNKKNKTDYEKALLYQISNFELSSNKRIDFYNEKGDNIQFNNFIKKSRVGFYFSKYDCPSCIEKSLEFFQQNVTKFNTIKSAFIMTNKKEYNTREAQILTKKHFLNSVFADFSGDSLMNQLVNVHKPFYFVIDENAVISSVFFIESNLDDSVVNRCLSYIIEQNNLKNNSSSHTQSIKLEHSDIEIANINLVNVKIRQPKSFFIKIKNNKPSDCQLEQIIPSCDCVVIDQQKNTTIKAHSEILVPAKILRAVKDSFLVNIFVKTDIQKEPATISVSGFVN